MDTINKFVSKSLRELADKIDAGNSNLTESEAMHILSVVAHERLTKEQACKYVNIQLSRFDDLVRAGVFPKGIKDKHINKLLWYKDELEIAIRQYRKRLTD